MKILIKQILVLTFFSNLYSNINVFNEEWLKMQSIYTEINEEFNKKQESLELYCHPHWINERKQIEKLIIGEPNPNFLKHRTIAHNMVRGDFNYQQEFEVAYLKHCISKNTQTILSNFKEPNFGNLPKECKEFDCSINSLGHLFYAAKVLESNPNKNISIITELGGGYGNLAYLFKKIIPKSTIILIDLPELCSLQYLFLKNALPNENIKVHTNLPDTLNEGEIHIIPMFLANNLTIETDLFISTFALSECSSKFQQQFIDKKFYNAKTVYITGQMFGWGSGLNFVNHDLLKNNINELYSHYLCNPFHIFNKTQMSYEILATDLIK